MLLFTSQYYITILLHHNTIYITISRQPKMTKKWKFHVTLISKNRSLWQAKVGPLDFTTAQKIKFTIKDFFSKCNQIPRKLWMWSNLLKKSLMENFIFCAVFLSCNDLVYAYLKFYDQDLFTHLWVMIELICTRNTVK